MSLRWRLTAGIGGVVALMLFGASFLAYVSAQRELNDQVDQFLQVRSVEAEIGLAALADPAAAFDEESIPLLQARGFERGTIATLERSDVSIQLLLPDRRVFAISEPVLPVTDLDHDRSWDGESSSAVLVDRIDDNGDRYRVRFSQSRFGTLMVGRAISDVEQTLSGLAGWLLLISGTGAVAASGVGWIVADRVLRPVSRLATATQQVADTQRFDADLRVEGTDELAAMATSFNSMLSALRASREQQERLVRDANHELRTPLTSLRTNLDVMRRRGDVLSSEERAMILDGMSNEVRELTDLVGELVGAATSPTAMSPEAFEEVDLVRICQEASQRTIERTGRTVSVSGVAMACVHGVRDDLERAVGNLLGNAVKFSPSEKAIEVFVATDSVEVHDRGPGIPADELERIFDRFYRSDSTRTLPGSGLGLAIVSDIAAAHGGSVFARNGQDGGAVVGFRVNPDLHAAAELADFPSTGVISSD